MGRAAVLPDLRSSRPNISLLVAKVRFNRRMVFGRAKSTRVAVAATADSVLEDVVGLDLGRRRCSVDHGYGLVNLELEVAKEEADQRTLRLLLSIATVRDG